MALTSPIDKDSEPWDNLCALLDIASDLLNESAPLTRTGAPPLPQATEALLRALDFAQTCPSWKLAALEQARQQEGRAFTKRQRTYLRQTPVHWSPRKFSVLLKSRGLKSATRNSLSAFSTLCTNLLPPSPQTDQVFLIRYDVGGKLLNLADQLCCNGHSGHPSGSIELRERLIATHGLWCKTIQFSSIGDYFFGPHSFGYGTWVNQLAEPNPTACSRWMKDLLDAAQSQITSQLPPPHEPHQVVDALNVFLPSTAKRSASNDSLGRTEWLWNRHFPLGPMALNELKILQAFASDNQTLLNRAKQTGAYHWLHASQAIVALHCGEPSRESTELRDAQGRWVALSEAMEIRKHLGETPSPNPTQSSTAGPRPRSSTRSI